MKLPDFRESTPLNRLRKALDAPLLQRWESTIEWERVEWTPLDRLAVEGIQVDLDDVTVSEDGSFRYTDRKVLVYIKDQPGSRSSGRSDYRFHVAWCSTLKKKQGQKEYKNRYVVTTRKDGRFPVGDSPGNGEEEKLVEMNVCRNCLSKLNYNNYRESRDQNIPEQFDIEAFFRQYEDPGKRGPLQQFKTFLLPSDD